MKPYVKRQKNDWTDAEASRRYMSLETLARLSDTAEVRSTAMLGA